MITHAAKVKPAALTAGFNYLAKRIKERMRIKESSI
jgi:hypothetical protein